MAIDHERVESIFNAAVALGSAAERAVYLDVACGQDCHLRERVEALLASHDAPGTLLARPAHPGRACPTGLATAPVAEAAGARIGRYKVLQLIGEGGFGSVFMAEQEHPVRRKVALKIIKLGMDTKQVIARFEAERQALAMMDHPNIARVLDAGATDTGRPYFVMELVKGVPITKYCDEHRLTPRDRLGLFIQVCHAVQHAHQKGIIHRDLKPSNVLVALYDGKPLPKVIDFGVAKATGQRLTEQTLFTGLGVVVGTPEYMSPEQAELNQLDVDTRSDIYSLGVLLYELLTGTTPLDRSRFKEAAVLEILRLVREEEPPKPSTRLSTTAELPAIAAQRGLEPRKLSSLVRGELDWIVMKALEKDRNRRYETANGFAADVQRYLNDEPVAACPPSATYRLKKLARRNKGGLAAAALVLLFLVFVGSGIGWTVRERAVRHARLAAQVELILTEVDRLEREQSWPEALLAARRAEASVLSGDADAATARRVRNRLKDAELIDRLEHVRMRRAVWVEGSWDFAGADREYARAFREHGVDVDRLAVEASIDRLRARPELAIALAATLDLWSHARRRAMKGDAADWQRLVVVARGIDPHPLRDRMRSAWQKPASQQDELHRLAESIDIRTEHPATLDRLSVSLKEAGQPGPALRLLRDARHFYPGDFWLNFELAYFLAELKDHEGAVRFYTAAISIRPNAVALHSNIGVALQNLGRLDEAVAACRKAIELDPKFAYGYANLSSALMRQKKLDEALAASRKALELDPTSAAIHNNLGIALKHQNKLDEAVACYRRAIELDPRDAHAYSNLGFALSDQGKLDEAVAACRKAIERDPKHAKAYVNLSIALRNQGKPDAAIAACRKAIELDANSAIAYSNLGSALSAQGKLDEAIAAHRKAIELDPGIAAMYHNLGVALDAQKKLDQAIVCYRKAIEHDPNFLQAYVNLGNALRVQKKLDEALVCHRKAVELDPNSAIAYVNLGVLLLDLKDYDGCVAACRRVIELDPKFPAAYTGLGTVLYYQNKLDEAAAAYRKAIELDPKDAIACNNLGEALRHQGKLDEAITAYKAAIAIDRQSPHAYNSLGWLLATCSDGKFRDPRQALALARKAVELAPTNPDGHRTLGAACYRTGDWIAAIAALEKSMELRGGGDSLDWFFLAMAHRQSGNEDEAQRWYDRAVEGMQTNTPADDELIRFRAEAAGLLRGK